MAEEKWVEVASVSRDDEADLLLGFLQAEGIEARIENQKFHMEPVNFGDLAVIRVLTREAEAAAAKAMLRRRDRQFEEMEKKGDESSLLTDSGPSDETGED